MAQIDYFVSDLKAIRYDRNIYLVVFFKILYCRKLSIIALLINKCKKIAKGQVVLD